MKLFQPLPNSGDHLREHKQKEDYGFSKTCWENHLYLMHLPLPINLINQSLKMVPLVPLASNTERSSALSSSIALIKTKAT